MGGRVRPAEESIHELEAEGERLSARTRDCDGAVAILEARLADADRKTARLREELASHKIRYGHLEACAAQTERALSDAAAELQGVYRSRSWRFTQPFRTLHTRLHPSRPPRPTAKEPSTPMPLRSEGHCHALAAGSAASPVRIPGPQESVPRSLTTPAATTSAAPLPYLKLELERRMWSEPSNWTLRGEYFRILEK